jgi:hypothetical protein
MPISVLLRFFMARSAAGVSTALSWEVGAGLTEEASTSPVAALLSELPRLGPEEPPVPLMVCPVDKVLLAEPMDPVAVVPLAAEPPLLDPPPLWAEASEEPPTSKIKITAMWFTERSST